MASVFSWLTEQRPERLRGVLVDIFVAGGAGATMDRVAQAEAIAGVGLAGDRYARGLGHWKLTDACQVTLVTEEDLRRAERRGELSFSAGQHRRNLVIRGIPLNALRRRQLRIGDAFFAFHRLRPPCGYLERLVGPGTGKALGKGAGVCLAVVGGGMLRVGDKVSLVEDLEGRGA